MATKRNNVCFVYNIYIISFLLGYSMTTSVRVWTIKKNHIFLHWAQARNVSPYKWHWWQSSICCSNFFEFRVLAMRFEIFIINAWRMFFTYGFSFILIQCYYAQINSKVRTNIIVEEGRGDYHFLFQ